MLSRWRRLGAYWKPVWHVQPDGEIELLVYQERGADHFKRRSKITQTQRLVKRLEHLGYAVEIQPLAA